MRSILILAAIALLASGCGHRRGAPPNPALDPAYGMRAAAQLNGALPEAGDEVSSICEPESLGYSKSSYVSLREAIAQCTDCDSAMKRRASRYLDEIDGSYRSAASSCRAYARCMQTNLYNETSCRSTLNNWEDAREDYADLAVRLREIEALMYRRPAAGPRPYTGLNRRERCDCSQSTGGVFANCCDRDSDSRYERGY